VELLAIEKKRFDVAERHDKSLDFNISSWSNLSKHLLQETKETFNFS